MRPVARLARRARIAFALAAVVTVGLLAMTTTPSGPQASAFSPHQVGLTYGYDVAVAATTLAANTRATTRVARRRPVGGPRPASLAFGSRRAARGGRVFANRAPADVARLGAFEAIPNSQLANISGRFNYVVREDGSLVVARTRYGHIDLANGDPVRAAGEVRVVQGEIRGVNNASGHYQPSGTSARDAALGAFRGEGYNVPGGAYREVH